MRELNQGSSLIKPISCILFDEIIMGEFEQTGSCRHLQNNIITIGPIILSSLQLLQYHFMHIS